MPSTSSAQALVVGQRAAGLPQRISEHRAPGWLEPEVARIPREGPGRVWILANLSCRYQLRGNMVSDAHLAALAIEHGLGVALSYAPRPALAGGTPVHVAPLAGLPVPRPGDGHDRLSLLRRPGRKTISPYGAA